MTPFQRRFWSKVVKLSGDGCWEWTAAKTSHGYGSVRHKRTMLAAHRVSFEMNIGEIPLGMFVLHKCDNRSCVRPDHLFLGTNQDNMDDKVAKGRQSRGPKHGDVHRGENNSKAKLTENDVRSIRSRFSLGSASQPQLAEEFGVDQSMVSLIVRGKRWAHVGGAS